MSDDLFPDFAPTLPTPETCAASAGPPPPSGPPRLRRADRAQIEVHCLALDQLLPEEHQARLVWDFVCGLDLSPLLQAIRAVEGHVGRDATDPRILMALWLYATLDGVSSARELDRLCKEHLAYQWLCGGVSLNYHTLADFRTAHVDVLDRLLTDSVAVLRHEGLVSLERVAQDGMRVRASAGAASFRRQATLEQFHEEARQQVEALKQEAAADTGAGGRQRQAARQRAARERQERLSAALQQLPQVQAAKEAFKKGTGDQARVSTTDPDARVMKMPDGGFRPAYNVQFASDTVSKVIVGVAVTNQGSDQGQLLPMVEQLVERHEQAPPEMLADGGFQKNEDIETLHRDHQTAAYLPVKNAEKMQARGEEPYQARSGDDPGVAAWRQRMGTAAARTIYKDRASTAELVNAQARNRGLYQVRVRGLTNVLAVALWYALAHLIVRQATLRRSAETAAETIAVAPSAAGDGDGARRSQGEAEERGPP